jgi:hypothetical protein
MKSFLSPLKNTPPTDYIIIAINIMGGLIGTIAIAILKPGIADMLFDVYPGIFKILPMGSKMGGIPMIAGIILCLLAIVRPKAAQLNVLQIYDLWFGLLMILSGANIVIFRSLPLFGYSQITYFLLLEPTFRRCEEKSSIFKR